MRYQVIADAEKITKKFEQLHDLEEKMEKFNSEVKKNKDRWKVTHA